MSVAAPAQAVSASASQEAILVVPIEGVIDAPTVALVHRALREVERGGYQALILDIDTPGGQIQSMRDIEATLRSLRESHFPTVAFVRQAFSAGAYIAFSCSRTFMSEQSSIGAITPVQAGPGGIAGIADEDVRRKLISALRSEVRSLLELRPGSSADLLLLGEAMVDPDMRIFEVRYGRDGGLEERKLVSAETFAALENDAAVEIFSQAPIGHQSPISLTAGEALDFGFSQGTYGSLEEMIREEFNVQRIEVLEPSWSESAVSWLEGFKPMLFVLGILLLVIEAKTPGIFIPGVMGALFIGLGMFSSYLVGLAEWTEILLFVLGLICIFVEILVLPGTLIFGLVGFLCVVLSLILSQQSFILPENASQQAILTDNILGMFWLIVLVVTGVIVLSRFMPKIPWVNRVLLLPPSALTGSSTQFAREMGPDWVALADASGVTLTDLRPAGSAELGDDRVDVVSEGGWIAKGKQVRVVDVQGNRIVVAPLEDPESGVASIGLLAFLVLLGFALVIAEVFFVSFGVLSIAASLSMATAVFLAFLDHGPTTGMSFLILSLGGSAAAIYFGFKYLPQTSIGKALILSGDEQVKMRKAAQEPELGAFMGRFGVASSDLRPAGFAAFDGQRVDVVTRGELIEKGSRLKVIQVEGNRVVVTLDTNSHSSI